MSQILKPKKGYKKVKKLFGIYEEIPEEWKITELQHHVELHVPMRDKPKKFDGHIPWLRIEDLDGKYATDSKSNQRVSLETINEMRLRVYPIGTVLCSCSATIGVCAITTKELTTNQTFIGITPNGSLDNQFLYYFLTTQKNYLDSVGSGSTILYISRKKFEKLKIQLPPLEEQQKIASILSNVDNLITNTQKIINQTKKIKKGLMQKLLISGIHHKKFKKVKFLFGKEIKIPKEWEIKKLETLVDVLDSKRIPIKRSEREKQHGKYPYYGASGIIDYVDDYIFDEKLLCLAEDGENLKSKVVPIAFTIENKTWVNNHTHVLRVNDEAEHYFLEYFLNYLSLLKYVVSTAIPKLNQKDMRSIPIICPELSEQQRIALILSNIDSQIRSQIEYKEKLEKLKKSLMQKLLTGEIRIKI